MALDLDDIVAAVERMVAEGKTVQDVLTYLRERRTADRTVRSANNAAAQATNLRDPRWVFGRPAERRSSL